VPLAEGLGQPAQPNIEVLPMNFSRIPHLSRLMLSALIAFPLASVLVGCGGTGKDEQAAYDVCLAAAKNDSRIGKATFASREQSNIQGSTGDSGIRVNIPYELDGKKGLYQCIAEKQVDNTFKVVS
jgi:hypothetical protein